MSTQTFEELFQSIVPAPPEPPKVEPVKVISDISSTTPPSKTIDRTDEVMQAMFDPRADWSPEEVDVLRAYVEKSPVDIEGLDELLYDYEVGRRFKPKERREEPPEKEDHDEREDYMEVPGSYRHEPELKQLDPATLPTRTDLTGWWRR